MGRQGITWKACATAAAAAAALSLNPLGAVGATAAAKPKVALEGSAIESTIWGDDSTREGKDASKHRVGWDASADLGSMYSMEKALGIHAAWARGVTGHGVTVAVIDSGVAPEPGLDRDGKVMDGPDLSYEGQSPTTAHLDSYGHGTHMAGIIAAKDEGGDPKKPVATKFMGVAPDAKLLNMKVGVGDGGVDVTQVIAALNWVVQHKDDQGMHVRVVNLAYGTESAQSWQVDPLAKAVEDAWNAGIVVVAAAGNDGQGADLLMPAIDPHVIAVGAVDHQGTATPNDDVVAGFTSSGTSTRRPDVLAPGKSVVSLRDPGSYVDQLHPEGLVPGDDLGRFFRGSGTSQSTAVVTGEVALLVQAKPSLTPDQVKGLLRATADRLPNSGDPAQGAGVVDVTAALDLLDAKSSAGWATAGQQAAPASSGIGSIEASRGGEHVVDPTTGDELTGERDAQGNPWDSTEWARASSSGTAWSKGGVWNGSTWTSDRWKDKAVLSSPWTGNSWNGVSWGQHQWSQATWESRSWRNDDWKSRSWRDESWKSRSWRSLD